MNEHWKETIRTLEKGQPVVWATIVEHEGSSPRKAATRMLFRENGETLGSVGGGRLEAETSRVAEALFREPGRRLIEISMTGNEIAETEMMCGGRAKIFVESLSGDALGVMRQIDGIVSRKKDAVFVTLVDEVHKPFSDAHWIFRRGDEAANPSGQLASTGLQTADFFQQDRFPVLLSSPEVGGYVFLEKLEFSPTLYIFGGGHISLDLAWMAHRVGFDVVVLDDREAFANRERFPMASEVKAVPFSEALDAVELGYGDFVVIVTRGHLHDLEVLRRVIAQSPEYIGMIGSRRKKGMIYGQLKKEGVAQEALDTVHAPVGLAIQAETPAEISVSIIAEMIQVRAGGRRQK